MFSIPFMKQKKKRTKKFKIKNIIKKNFNKQQLERKSNKKPKKKLNIEYKKEICLRTENFPGIYLINGLFYNKMF